MPPAPKRTRQGNPTPFLVGLLWPHRARVAVSAALGLAAAGAAVALPLLVGLAAERIDLRDQAGLFAIVAGIVGVGLAGALVYGAQGVVSGRVAQRVERDLRGRLYEHLHSVVPEVLMTQQTGEVVALTTADLVPISDFLGVGITTLAVSATTILVAAVVMLTIEPLLALLALAPVPLTLLLVWRYQVRVRPIVKASREQIGAFASLIQESVAGAETIRAFGRNEDEVERVRRSGERLLERLLQTNRLISRFQPTVMALPYIGLAMVIIIGGYRAISGDVSIVTFVGFYSYVVLLIPALTQFGSQLGVAQSALACCGRVMTALDHPVEDLRGYGATVPAGPMGLDLSAVTVVRGGERAVLSEIEVTVGAGRSLAIVGTTGSGKSTLVSLTNRLQTADSGQLWVGGYPIDELPLASLRRAVSQADDRNFLFTGTIAENIVFARPEATDDEISAAVRAADAKAFIDALPHGLATRLGPRGTGLSGGQRQRLCLARALLSRPGILLVDNGTGSLDAASESRVLSGIRTQSATNSGITQIIVAYRPAPLIEADEIIVLDEGRVVERGTHEELVRRSALYRRLIGASP